jgi:hypothetical protein
MTGTSRTRTSLTKPVLTSAGTSTAVAGLPATRRKPMTRCTTATSRTLWLRGAAVSQLGEPPVVVQRFVVTREAAILAFPVVVVEFVVTKPDQPRIHRTRLLVGLAVNLGIAVYLRVAIDLGLAVDLLRPGHRIDRLLGRRGPELLTLWGLVAARPVVTGVGIAGIAVAIVIRRTTVHRATLDRLATVTLVATMTLVAAVTLVTVRVAPAGA